LEKFVSEIYKTILEDIKKLKNKIDIIIKRREFKE